jgi:hypothetical protein
MFEEGQIGSAIAAFKVYDDYKAIVVHGHDQGEFEYGRSASIAINKLKTRLLDRSKFKHTKFIASIIDTFIAE